MLRFLLCVVVMGALVGCGKNDNFSQQGQLPPPVPPPGQFPPPGGGFGPNGPTGPGFPPQAGPPGGFRPQLPPGQPRTYTPFVPIHIYIDHYYGQQWQEFYGGWQNFSRFRGYHPHDFGAFWYDYCPWVFQGNMPGWYTDFGSSYYHWMQPGVPVIVDAQPELFWQNYVDYPLPQFYDGWSF